MALPAALLYLLIAVPSRVGYSFSAGGELFGGNGHAGVEVLRGTLIAFGWFVVLGYAIGQWWLPRGLGGGAGASSRPSRLPAWLHGSIAAGPLAIGVGVVGVLIAAGGVATAKSGTQPADLGPVSGVFTLGAVGASSSIDEGSSSSGGSAEVFPASPPPVTGGPATDQAGQDLRDYAAAEEVYFTENETYTIDPSRLTVVAAGAATSTVTIARADTSSYCLEAFTTDGQVLSYDSAVRLVTPGATC
jgi:hypothetical protein